MKKKKTPSGTVWMKMCTKFSADWNRIRYRSGSTFVFVTNSRTNILVIGHFVLQKVWKAYKQIFRNIGGKQLWKLVHHNTSFGRIKNTQFSFNHRLMKSFKMAQLPNIQHKHLFFTGYGFHFKGTIRQKQKKIFIIRSIVMKIGTHM